MLVARTSRVRGISFDEPSRVSPAEGDRRASVGNVMVRLLGDKSMNENGERTAWPDFAIALFDLLSGRKAELTWEFENMEVHVPMTTGTNTEYAVWKFNGLLKVRAREEMPG
jgi:hypothetical protein